MLIELACHLLASSVPAWTPANYDIIWGASSRLLLEGLQRCKQFKKRGIESGKRIGKIKKGVDREFRDELWKNMLCYKEAKIKQMFEQ